MSRYIANKAYRGEFELESSKKARNGSTKSDAAQSAMLMGTHLCVGTETAIYSIRLRKRRGEWMLSSTKVCIHIYALQILR